MMVPQHPEYKSVSSIEMSPDEWSALADYSRKHYPGMEIIACVYERSSVDFCEKINIDAYKIHSADLSNPYLVEYAAGTGKRIDLSVGASTLEEIQTALEWIQSTSDSLVWLMYGYQNFPTKPDEIHLDYIKTLRESFNLPIGYQDHSDAESDAAYWLPAYAMGLGISIQEKHITHDRSLKGFDHEAALNPDEFALFVQMIRTIEGAKGISTPRPFSEEELKYRKYAKKSLVAADDLSAGHVISKSDLAFMRAEELGLPPDQGKRLIGKKTKHKINKFQIITEDDIA
jgi:sialic acid synthase SpsE